MSDLCYKCKTSGYQVPVDYCVHCIRRNPSCFCEHGVFMFKGNQLDVCSECDDEAEIAALEAKAANGAPGHEWDESRDLEFEDQGEDEPLDAEDLEDEELEGADLADLANSEDDCTQDLDFVVHEGEEGLPQGFAAQLGRGVGDVEFKGADEQPEEVPEGKGDKARALDEVQRFWVQERWAPARRAEVIRQYRLIEGLSADLFSDEDVAFMLDAQWMLGEREESVVWDMAQAYSDSDAKAALKKRPFRFQGRVALLTYIADAKTSLDQFAELVRSHEWHEDKTYEQPKWSVGLERCPSTGRHHFHVFIDFLTKMNIKGHKRFIINGWTADIKTVTKGQYRDKLEYTMKGGQYVFHDRKEAWLPRNSRGFKTAVENHELWRQKLHQAKQRSPFPLTLLGPESKVLREPKAGEKKRHWVIKSAPDAGKSWWAHTVAAGAAVFFPRKGNKYPLEVRGNESPLTRFNVWRSVGL